ncbi:MAG: transcriptional regulator NrdR [Halobacteriovoraceae bacterium]|nr:transcriptional regulator NrdR [Halobacteriovoraceae bacterium]|tara:strand:+ start:225756 stop:226295 length:540 start_codon:yes stop_codon:yes gene_type:complete
MYCPSCQTTDTKVIETRILNNGMTIRRRRRCEQCDKRFTTYEMMNIQVPDVAKADGRREAFNRDKIVKGLTKACQKRAISRDQIHALIDSLERYLTDLNEKEVTTDVIGNYVMKELYKLDPVSYVRFASFYWEFDNIPDFVDTLEQNIRVQKKPILKNIINRDEDNGKSDKGLTSGPTQ